MMEQAEITIIRGKSRKEKSTPGKALSSAHKKPAVEEGGGGEPSSGDTRGESQSNRPMTRIKTNSARPRPDQTGPVSDRTQGTDAFEHLVLTVFSAADELVSLKK